MTDGRVTVTSGGWPAGRRVRRVFLDWWSGHPSIDLYTAIVVVGLHLLYVDHYRKADIFAWSGSAGRAAEYAAGAGVMSLIAGFTGTAIAQYGSSSGDVVTRLRQTHGKAIRTNWLDITSWLLISAAMCIIALAMSDSATVAPWIFEGAFIMSLLKFARLVFLFRLILLATDRQATETSRTPSLKVYKE